jgi:hypothetical protein
MVPTATCQHDVGDGLPLFERHGTPDESEATMLRPSLLTLLLFASSIGCGQEGMLRIIGVWSVDGGDLDKIEGLNAGSLGAMASDTVDSTQGLCAKSAADCVVEPFTGHYAVVRLVNEYPEDNANPLFGKVTLKDFVLTLTPATDDAPELREQSGDLLYDIRSQESRNVVLPLVDPDMKADFARNAGTQHFRYDAMYTLRFVDRGSLQTSTSIVVGPFNACAKGYTPVGVCPISSNP